jgi:hypothetical protein
MAIYARTRRLRLRFSRGCFTICARVITISRMSSSGVFQLLLASLKLPPLEADESASQGDQPPGDARQPCRFASRWSRMASDGRQAARPRQHQPTSLPPYSPELNPVENIWQFLRQNHLSNRIFKNYIDILDACCAAWNALVEEPKRIASIATRDWASVIP